MSTLAIPRLRTTAQALCGPCFVHRAKTGGVDGGWGTQGTRQMHVRAKDQSRKSTSIYRRVSTPVIPCAVIASRPQCSTIRVFTPPKKSSHSLGWPLDHFLRNWGFKKICQGAPLAMASNAKSKSKVCPSLSLLYRFLFISCVVPACPNPCCRFGCLAGARAGRG